MTGRVAAMTGRVAAMTGRVAMRNRLAWMTTATAAVCAW